MKACSEIDRDYLASRFAANYQRNRRRGYGGTAHYILQALCKGEDWREVAPAVFDGRVLMITVPRGRSPRWVAFLLTIFGTIRT